MGVMRSIVLRPLLVAALVSSTGLPSRAAAAPPAIVERAIELHGGDLYTSTRTRLTLCSLSGCYDLDVTLDGGRYDYRVEGTVRGERWVVRSTNDELEWWVDGVAREPEPERVQALADWASARVYFCFLPFRLADPAVGIEDLGLEVWEGRALHKVRVRFDPGSSTDAEDEYLYWFDPETARLEQFAYSFQGEPGGLRFRRGFNYRRIGGILFFDQENLGVDADGLSVDDLDPPLVATLRRVSTVTLEEIRVEPLAP